MMAVSSCSLFLSDTDDKVLGEISLFARHPRHVKIKENVIESFFMLFVVFSGYPFVAPGQ